MSKRNAPLTYGELLDGIKAGRFVLPEIQREFVWDLDRVAELWDSIFRGYPIGQLLFWKTVANLPMYSFFDKEDEAPYLFVTRRPVWAHRAMVSGNGKEIVLDGQQRLTSLFLGARADDEGALGVNYKARKNSETKKRFLCIYNGEIGDDDDKKLFMWREEESEGYITVARALNSKVQGNAKILRDRMRDRAQAVPVSYVTTRDVEMVVEIFQRLNTNGRNMTSSELFLAMWLGMDKAGSLKKEFVKLKEDFGVDFDVKDAMITQLLRFVFSGGKDELAEKKISLEMFERIAKGMNGLHKAAKATVKFLNEDCGIYSNGEMTSHNLFIPLVAVFYKYGDEISEKLKKELRCFVYRALMFGLFERSTTELMALLWDAVEGLKPGGSLIRAFLAMDNKRIKNTCFGDYDDPQWLDTKIDELLVLHKGTKTNMVLLLLKQEKANVDGEMFDQDHLFPAKLFNSKYSAKALKTDRHGKYGIRVDDEIREDRKMSDEEIRKWGRIAGDYAEGGLYDTLPNLWLLDSKENRSKGKKLPKFWLEDRLEEINKKKGKKVAEKYLKDLAKMAYLGEMKEVGYLNLLNFEQVFEDRDSELHAKLAKLLARV